MIGYYILDENGKTVATDDVLEWARFIEKPINKILKQDDIDDYKVSTVFLGIDHNFADSGAPILWETMVFKRGYNGKVNFMDLYQQRYPTRAAALKGHKKAMILVKSGKLKEKKEDE